MARPFGARSRATKERKAKEKVSLARIGLAKQETADFKAQLDSLAILEEVMRHFYFKAKLEQTAGEFTNWKAVDQAMEAAGKWAEKVANFRHARLAAIKLAGDPNAPLIPDGMTVDELRANILAEIERLSTTKVLDLAPLLPASEGT